MRSTPPTPIDRFEQARSAYLIDGPQVAAPLFQQLLDTDDLPRALQARTMVFLGEIALISGDLPAAEGWFMRTLQLDPTWEIDTLEHTLEVLGAFERARRRLQDSSRAPPPVRKPYPWWGYAPLGIPQFGQNKPVRGAVYLGLQAGAVAGWVGATTWVNSLTPRITDPRLPQAQRQAARDRALLVRQSLYYPTATLLYLSWGVSVVDGAVSWKRGLRPPDAVGIAPQPGGAQLTVRWRW